MLKISRYPNGITQIALASTWWGRHLMFCHAYLVDGLLVDCGHPRGAKEFAAWLDTAQVEQAVVTHYHEDHAGNIPCLNSRGIVPFAHPAALAWLKNPPRLLLYERVLWGQSQPGKAAPVGDSILTSRRCFRVIPTPGHSQDHLVLLEEQEGWLFAGDLYLGERLYYLRGEERVSQMIASLSAVLQADFDMVFCAHRGVVAGGKRRLAKKRDFLMEKQELARELYQRGKSEKEITTHLFGREGWMTWVTAGDLSKNKLVRSLIAD
ncbi:MAG: MBL fold metallo-hydrolase [Bacillota bacterium]